MEKIAISFFSLAVLLLPATALAVCTENGATVVYINGILTSRADADDDLAKLKKEYQDKTQDNRTKFIVGYNPSHIGGGGDLYKSIVQAYQTEGSFVADTDLTTILLQIHPQVTTQKVVVVGHSQGTFYTNDLYKYLTSHGVSENSIAVYNIATPASFVKSKLGQYLTSSTDKVINRVREGIKHAPSVESFGAGAALATVPQTMPKDPLPPNTSFVLNSKEIADENGGHSFSNVYLENAPGTIVSTISNDLSGLSSTADFNGDCFVKPSEGISYQSGRAGLGFMDFVAAKAGPPLAFTRDFIADVGTKVPANFAAAAGAFFSAITPTPRTSNLPGSHSVVGALYGSSVTEKNLREFGLLEDQGGAVVLAISKPPAPKQTDNGEVKGAETEKPQEPLIPQPKGAALSSPGFGGGGGSSPAAVAVATEDTSTDATSTATSTTPDPPPSPPAPEEPVVPDGTPPNVITLTINGTELATTSPFATTPVATTTTTWSAVITFNENISTAPNVKDGTPSFDFTNGTEQTVNDCTDSDAKTFCFTYIPPPNIEAAVFWFFRVAGAQDSSGETLASTTYRFIVDTAGPALTLDASATNQTLPTISGTSSFTSATIVLLLNAIQYSFGSPNGLWSFAVQPGSELAEGAYPVIATSTDQYNNQVVHNWTFIVDTNYPVLGLTSGPAEGDSVASTSPVNFEFSATDATALAYSCALDGGSSSTCTSPHSFSPAPGARSFAVTATDAAGNATTTVRSFVVLP